MNKYIFIFTLLLFGDFSNAKIPKDLRQAIKGPDMDKFFNVKISLVNDLKEKDKKHSFAAFLGACHAIHLELASLNLVKIVDWPVESHKRRTTIMHIMLNIAAGVYRLKDHLENSYLEEKSLVKWFKYGSNKMRNSLSDSDIDFREKDLNILIERHDFLMSFSDHCVEQLLPSIQSLVPKQK